MVAVPPSVVIVPLPPYPPQLNLMERVLLYLRYPFLSLRIRESYEAIAAAVCETRFTQ